MRIRYLLITGTLASVRARTMLLRVVRGGGTYGRKVRYRPQPNASTDFTAGSWRSKRFPDSRGDWDTNEVLESVERLLRGPESAAASAPEYAARIEVLREEAATDGIAINGASERDFWAFVGWGKRVKGAQVVLMDNGNLRAVWEGRGGSHVGLQFRGDETVVYVIFSRRAGASGMSRVAGVDTLEGVKAQVRAFDLESVLGA